MIGKLITRGTLEHLSKFVPMLEDLCEEGADTDTIFSADLIQKDASNCMEMEDDENYDPNVRKCV